jgi:hypothetical protein
VSFSPNEHLRPLEFAVTALHERGDYCRAVVAPERRRMVAAAGNTPSCAARMYLGKADFVTAATLAADFSKDFAHV